MPIPIQNNVSPRSHHLAIGAACVLVAGILAWLLIARPATDSAPTGAVRDGVSVTATAPTATLVVGQQLAVKVLVDTREFSVSAVDLALAYDAKRLKIIGVKSGGFLPVVLTEGAAANGRATIIIGSGTKPVSGSGAVMAITVEAIASGEAIIEPTTDTKIAAAGHAKSVTGRLVPLTLTIR